MFGARTSNLAATFAIGLYIAKFLGVAAFGQFSFILYYCFLFSVISSLGLGTLVIRDAVKAPQRRSEFFSNASFIVLASSGLGLIVMLGGTALFDLSRTGRVALWVMCFSVVPSTLICIWESLLISFEKNHYIAAVQSVEAVLKIILGYTILVKGYGIVYLMILFLAARVCSGILYFVVLHKVLAPLRLRIDFSFIRKMLAMVPTFAGLYIFSVLFSKIDLLMLVVMKDFNDVGIYSAAYKLLELSFMLPTCIITVLFPILSRYAQSSPERFVRLSSDGVFYSSAVVVPIVIGCIYFADHIIFRVYSERFAGSVLCFQILIATLGVYMMDQMFAHSLVARDLQRLNLRALVLATLINVGLNCILIPRYSFIGASISTLVAMVFLVMTHYYFTRKYLYRFELLKMVGTMVGCVGIAGSVFWLVDLSLVISLPLGVLIYISGVLVIKSIVPIYGRALAVDEAMGIAKERRGTKPPPSKHP